MKTAKTIVILSSLLVTASATAATAASSEEANEPAPLTIELFYNELAPYGEWVETSDYGWAWAPDGAGGGWRPYMEGYWVYADDYGWTWVSDNIWGWGPFHYGRWTRSNEYGWIWIPGTEWGPAWVACRAGDNWIGWAPLPPQAVWGEGGIVHDRNDMQGQIIPAAWSFVKTADLQQREIEMFTARAVETAALLQETEDVTNLVVEDGRLCNRSLAPDVIEQRTGHPVARFRITDFKSPGRAQPTGGEIAMFRPAISKEKPAAAPPAKPVISSPERATPGRERGARRPAATPATPPPARPRAPAAGPPPVRPRTEAPRAGQTR